MVSDTGIGIKPEKQEIIFEQFIQGDDRISRQYGGTGLGLSIVKKLTSMMGDGVKLESEPGQGSTFRFNLPGKMVQ
jgi:signal transduction histidine kinase